MRDEDNLDKHLRPSNMVEDGDIISYLHIDLYPSTYGAFFQEVFQR